MLLRQQSTGTLLLLSRPSLQQISLQMQPVALRLRPLPMDSKVYASLDTSA